MEHRYKPQGVCSTEIIVEVENNIIKNLKVINGCNGNLQGLSRLVKGMSVNDVISRLEGVRCGRRSTSCPDQLCRALHEMGF